MSDTDSEAPKCNISFSGDGAMQINATKDDIAALTPTQREVMDRVAACAQAYLKAARSLLSGRYQDSAGLVSSYLRERGNVLVACCEGGVVIRYERASEEPKLVAGWLRGDLNQVARKLSQNLVHCYSSPDEVPQDASTATMTLRAIVKEPDRPNERELFTAKVRFDVVVQRPEAMPKAPMKPFCVASIRNYMELSLGGYLAEDERRASEGRSMLMRIPIRFPVGWDCIEIFPFVELESWRPEAAPVWAENDILAAIVTARSREASYQSLDPHVESRRVYASILKEFKVLLESNPDREESLQIFLKRYPELLCPAYKKVWPKLQLGRHVTDFVFRDAVGEYLLVELERSQHVLFRRNDHPSAELNHACDQIVDWKRYIADNLATVQRESGLAGISSHPRAIVVIGRSASLSPEHRRKLAAIETERPRVRILTYDDVYDNAKSVIGNMLGPIWEPGGKTSIYYPRS